MPTECAISTCPNNTRRTGKAVSYFTFPKDPAVRKKWILACRRKDNHFNPNFARICSAHFCETGYFRDLKAELLGYVPARRLLKKDAYPTLNLREELVTLSPSKMPCQSAANNSFPHDNVNCTVSPGASSHTLSLRQSRAKKREIRKRALDRLRNLSPKLNKPNKDSVTNTNSIKVTTSNTENLQQIATLNTENLQQITTSNTENLQEVKTSNMEVIQLTTPHRENVKQNCSKCSMLKREIHSKTVEVRRIVMQLKIADNQADIMRKKIAQLEIQNRQLKEMLKTKILFETSLHDESMQK